MEWTHFVTLQFNDPMRQPLAMRRALFHWDAKSNRYLLGKRWQKKPDERLLWIAFTEKLEILPHWHLALQVLPEQIGALSERQSGDNSECALAATWGSVGPSFTCDVKIIENVGAINYITKHVGVPDNLANFVHSREVLRN